MNVLLVLVVGLALVACRKDMVDQERTKPLRPSSFFTDDGASRPLPEGTLPQEAPRELTPFHTGLQTGGGGALVVEIPQQITSPLLERGKQRFEIFCAVCHGAVGYGAGMIVQRGFPPPPSFHIDRLRSASAGHFFQVITKGYGLMYPYGYRVNPADRWAIVAYIRALQLSQHASLEDATPEGREQLSARSECEVKP